MWCGGEKITLHGNPIQCQVAPRHCPISVPVKQTQYTMSYKILTT